jgi:hypothetical protein
VIDAWLHAHLANARPLRFQIFDRADPAYSLGHHDPKIPEPLNIKLVKIAHFSTQQDASRPRWLSILRLDQSFAGIHQICLKYGTNVTFPELHLRIRARMDKSLAPRGVRNL